MTSRRDAADPAIPLMLWWAYEPRFAASSGPELEWLKHNAPNNPLITNHILPRAVRRLAVDPSADKLATTVDFLSALPPDSDIGGVLQALAGVGPPKFVPPW